MLAAVKWLYATDTEQQRPALCVVHEQQMLCVQAGAGCVRCVVRPSKEFIGLRQVSENGLPYSIKRAIAKLQETGLRLGITKSAARILGAIEADDEQLLMQHAPFTDEEGKTMINDEDNEEETTSSDTPPPAPKAKRAPLPKAKILPSKKAPAEAKHSETTTTTKKETTMPSKKNSTKKAAPAAKKVVAKKSATTKAAPGEGGFRVGSNMEKGFIAYKADRAKYQKFERGDKQAWAQKLADKLGTTLNSVRTMISKNWEPALDK